MAKNKISDYDGVTAGNNLDIGGISIDEGMLPSAVNNSLRELTKQLGAFADGTDGIDVLNLHDDDASASIKIQAPAIVTTTTTLTLPDGAGSSGQVLTTNGSGTLSWSSNGLSNVVEDTTPELGGTLSTNGNDITFGDNDKATFGDAVGGDLQIYHDALNSYIVDSGTGDLIVQGGNNVFIKDGSGNNMLRTTDGAQVRLYYGNATRLDTTSGGIDVTGTVTADGLTISQSNPTITITDTDGSTNTTLKTVGSNTELSNPSGGNLRFRTNASELERMRVSPDGDISFYDSTGVTQGFFWDASTQRLGLGVTAPASNLHVKGNNAEIRLEDSAVANATWRLLGSTGGTTKLFRIFDSTNSADRLVIDGSGNVGIGTVPTQKLHVDATGSTTAALFDNNGTNGDVVRVAKNGTDILKIRAEGTADLALDASNGSFIFKEGGTEAMRINSSGHLLVGATAYTGNTTNTGGGVYVDGSGSIVFSSSTGGSGVFNRISTDGNVVEFRKDGSTVGSIGTTGSDLTISSSVADHSGLRFALNNVLPMKNGSIVDAAIDLGQTTGTNYRFKDLYLSGQANVGTAVAATQTASVTGSTTLDFSTYQNFILTMTGNITLANPTTEETGQSGFIIFIHSGAARTVSLGTDYETAGGAGLTLSGTAGAVDIVPYVVQSSGNILLGTPQLAFA